MDKTVVAELPGEPIRAIARRKSTTSTDVSGPETASGPAAAYTNRPVSCPVAPAVEAR